MLPVATQQAIKDAFPAIYWVPIDDSSINFSEWGIQPEIRWANEEYEGEDTSPYEAITLQFSPQGVIEGQQSVDKRIAVSEPPGGATADPDSDVETIKARRAYDVLNLSIEAVGSETRAGLELSQTERGGKLAEAVFDWLANRFPTRPIDAFNPDGHPVDISERVYADELTPPVRIDTIMGRGVAEVTQQVDADGAQFDAAVEMHYFDTWSEGAYSADTANVGMEMDFDIDADELVR